MELFSPFDFPLLERCIHPDNQWQDTVTHGMCLDGFYMGSLLVSEFRSAATVDREGWPQVTLMASTKASHFQSGPCDSQVPRPFWPAWVVAWALGLQSHCLPAPGPAGLWRGVVAEAPLGSGCPRLCLETQEVCRAALGQNRHPSHSSIPFYRSGGLSWRTVPARSAVLEAAGWGPWWKHLCQSHYCFHLH